MGSQTEISVEMVSSLLKDGGEFALYALPLGVFLLLVLDGALSDGRCCRGALVLVFYGRG